MFSWVRIAVFILVSQASAEESVGLDQGDSGSGGYSMNVISTDYAEVGIIVDEIPKGSMKDQKDPNIQKVKVHKSAHRKHKKLSLVRQPRENPKIEELSDKKKTGSRKKYYLRGKNTVDMFTLSTLQENVPYQWFYEVVARQ